MFQCSTSEPPIVTVKQGKLQGHWLDLNIKNYQQSQAVAQFLEVPYACPPVGKNRYQKPLALLPWKELQITPKNPTRSPPQLPFRDFGGQHPGEEMWNPKENASEDCLFLNIWCPFSKEKEEKQNALPVMVWIHGGGFISGSTCLDVYNGAVLAAVGKVLVVSVSYRLGPLGFLPIPDSNDPSKICANQGLWDQHAALLWIKENIQFFGGDNNNVCLFGESAGAVCVGLHILSPYSKGLFHKGIMQSGSPLAEWAMTPLDQLIKTKEEFQQELLSRYPADGYTEENILQNIPFDLLIEHSLREHVFLKFAWTPCVDGDYIPEEPKEMLMKPENFQIPLLIGIDKDEGSYFVLYEDIDKENIKIPESKLNELFSICHRTALHSDLYSQILNKYSPSNSKNVTENVLLSSAGDRYFIRDALQFVKMYQKESSWFYRFCHRSVHHPWPTWCGVLHADEIPYVFGDPLRNQVNCDEEDYLVGCQMLTLWTNFAKYGEPKSPEVLWEKAFDKNSNRKDSFPRYLEIGSNTYQMKSDSIIFENLEFLDKILSK